MHAEGPYLKPPCWTCLHTRPKEDNSDHKADKNKETEEEKGEATKVQVPGIKASVVNWKGIHSTKCCNDL